MRFLHKRKCDCPKAGLKLAFKAGKLRFYGGPIDEIDFIPGLVLDASRQLAGWGDSSCNDAAKELFPKSASLIETDIPLFQLSWNDYQAPAVPPEFWHTLLAEIKQSNIKKIACCCVGGHGRTGTMLAIFAGLLDLASDPVAYVRKNYCRQAVESSAQIRYVEQVTGKEVKVKAELALNALEKGGGVYEMY